MNTHIVLFVNPVYSHGIELIIDFLTMKWVTVVSAVENKKKSTLGLVSFGLVQSRTSYKYGSEDNNDSRIVKITLLVFFRQNKCINLFIFAFDTKTTCYYI